MTAAAAPARFRNTVGTEQVEAARGEWIESFNPYTGRVWAEIPRGGPADVDAAVQAAHAAFTGAAWADLRPSARGKLLVRVADLMGENAERLAAIEVRDDGKLMA